MSNRVIYSKYVLSPPQTEWVLTEIGEADFFQFGVDFEEFETGPGNYSTAILKLDDGQVVTVRADHIQFINKDN